jgi:predicted Zn-dependent protease
MCTILPRWGKGRSARLYTACAQLAFAFLFCSAARAQQSCPMPALVSPPTGASIFTAHQEEDLGDIEAEWLEKEYEVLQDDRVTPHLNEIASRIQAQFSQNEQKIRVIIIDIPQVNSFSVGAGRIYLTRQMVGFLRRDDELASLLGHEMGHIYAHQNAVVVTQMFHDILGVTSVGDRKDISAKYDRLLDGIGQNKGSFRTAAVRMEMDEKSQQYEADRIALSAAAAAGFSPRAFADFFDRFAQTHGKRGNLLTDIFGVTKPNERRLREIHKSLSRLPQPCREIAPPLPTPEFLAWQADVIAYQGLAQR